MIKGRHETVSLLKCSKSVAVWRYVFDIGRFIADLLREVHIKSVEL